MPLGIITLEDVLEGSFWNLVPYPILIMSLLVELIGEEIYDEFDQEGAYGDRVPYESPSDTRECDDGDLKEPYHLSSITNQSDRISRNDQAKSLATVLPTSLKGFEFFRTRSAPPVPREIGTDKYVGDDKVAGREWDNDEKDGMSRGRHPTAIQMPKPIKGTGRYPPSIILEQHSTVSSYDSAVPTAISVEAKSLTTSPSADQNRPSSMVTAPTPARLAPSAPLPRPQAALPTQTMSALPTLEAILLERKRRASNTSASNSSSPVPIGPHINPTSISPRPAPSAGSFGSINSVPGNPVTPLRAVHSSGKGIRFKSSPLGGGGDRAGVVVAEQVKAAKKSEDTQSPDQEQEDRQVEKAGFGKD